MYKTINFQDQESLMEATLHIFSKNGDLGILVFDEIEREYFKVSDQDYETFTWQGVPLSQTGTPPIYTRSTQTYIAMEDETMYNASTPPFGDPQSLSFILLKNETVKETWPKGIERCKRSKIHHKGEEQDEVK